MLVTRETFNAVLEELVCEPVLVVDAETTGLEPWLGDRLFSLIIGVPRGKAFYFNFNRRDEFTENEILDKEYLAELQYSLLGTGKTLLMHNAKFDMGMLAQERVFCVGHIYDTEVNARLQYNDHMRYQLGDCGKRIGVEKSEAVELYIAKHKLFRNEVVPGSKKKKKKKFYDQVPRDVIIPYGLQDAAVTGELFLRQMEGFTEQEKELSRNEAAFTQVLFAMESCGIKIDREYCKKGFAEEHAAYSKMEEEFKTLTGETFVDSGKNLARLLGAAGITLPLTEKGNYQVAEKVLLAIDHPLVNIVLTHRDHSKRAHTYYQNLLLCADGNDIVHTDFKQAGTRTGRLSCKTPNLQNIPKQDEDDEEINTDAVKIRKAIVPRPGFFFVEIDYKAMEFRMMLDYAGQKDLIAAIQAGLDPHQATANLAGISRRSAKTLNFLLLYGGGVEKLAGMLKIPVKEAANLRAKYFASLGGVKRFIRGAMGAAQTRGWVMNWAGRRYYYPKSDFAYKAPNAIIQGGSAEVVKYAMVELATFLSSYKSRMVLQVHDSVLFEVHETEAGIVEELAAIMERAYPHKLLAMACDIKWSKSSWGELEKWETYDKSGNELSAPGVELSSDPT